MWTSTLLRRLFGGIVCTMIGGTLAGQTPSTLEERIRRVVDAMPPAVIVKGEPAATAKLAGRMAALHVPGVGIAVIHEGRIEWARGFGVTRIGGPPVTPDTLFQAASISKPVAAMAVLHLVQAGKLSLDTDVNEYLKSWKVPANSFTERRKVTIRELLTHTAGMTVHGFAGYAAGAPVPALIEVLNGEKPANSPPIRVDIEPGTLWRYSGGGYVVVQQLLLDVTGEPFPKLMHDTVLAPIGMTRSTYQQPLPQDRMAEVATPYRADGEPVPGGPHVYPEMAPAGLWTTPSDLARYAIEVQKSLAGTSNKVLSAAMVRQMLAPGLNHQGLGPALGGSAEHPYFDHGGANEGYRCNLIAFEHGDGLVVMTNSDSGGQLAAEIERSVAREYGWPDFQPVERTIATVDPQTLESYVGAYQSPRGLFTVTREGDRLFVQLSGQPKFPAFPESAREFFLKAVDAQFTFQVDAQGKATGLTLRQNGMVVPANRVEGAEAQRMEANAASLARRFQEQKPAPGSEAAMRRLIEELREGRPDYSQLFPEFAAVIRQGLPEAQASAKQLGAVLSVTFKRVESSGGDVYEVKFQNGTLECHIALTPDGKIAGMGFRPSQP
ncbi:MAG TPA: serine hydrolase [Bryobacteraceae bacterium]|nr:serine hydrolase [Bryobacteraceae bacterium]